MIDLKVQYHNNQKLLKIYKSNHRIALIDYIKKKEKIKNKHNRKYKSYKQK